MSAFEWFLVVVAIVLWTIVICAFGFGVGYTYLKDRREEGKDAFITRTGPPGPPGVAGAMGPQGMAGKDGKTPDAHDIIMYNGDNLFDWGEAIYERIKRVERKSGMSV